MPNQLERELNAIHCSIAEIKRQMDTCVSFAQLNFLERKLAEYEKERLRLLREMAVEL